MHKISVVGLFCCDIFEETPKQKVINMSKLNKFHFRLNLFYLFQELKSRDYVFFHALYSKEFWSSYLGFPYDSGTIPGQI